jgi:hypothetical protein
MYGHFAEIFTVKSAGGCTAKENNKRLQLQNRMKYEAIVKEIRLQLTQLIM